MILKTSVTPDSLFIGNKKLYHCCISPLISWRVLCCGRFCFICPDKTMPPCFYQLNKQDCMSVYWEPCRRLSYPMHKNVTAVVYHATQDEGSLSFKIYYQGKFLGGTFSLIKPAVGGFKWICWEWDCYFNPVYFKKAFITSFCSLSFQHEFLLRRWKIHHFCF